MRCLSGELRDCILYHASRIALLGFWSLFITYFIVRSWLGTFHGMAKMRVA